MKFLIVAVVLIVASAAAVEKFDRGFIADINGNNYYISTVLGTLEEAEQQCVSLDRNLVSLEEYEEDLNVRLYLLDLGLGANKFLTSGAYSELNSVWEWKKSDGNLMFTYTFWDQDEPSGDVNYCMAIHGVGWRAYSCAEESFYYICE